MADRHVTLANYKRTYQNLLKTCHQLEKEALLKHGVCGVWSPKQVIDHLSAWNEEGYNRFEAALAGNFETIDIDDDSFNAQAVMDRKSLSWAESLAELDEIFQKNTRFILHLDDKNWESTKVFEDWLNGWADDFVLHGDQLKLWVKGA